MNFRDHIPVLGVLVLLFMLAILIVNPSGNIPLNDDWYYGLLVRSLYEKGAFFLRDEISPNMLWQPYWGYFFCWINGAFSFEALRYSTLFLAIVNIPLFSGLLRMGNVSRLRWPWATLMLVFSPVVFLLSFTFMTDLPFLTAIFGTWLALRLYLQRGRSAYRWIGYALAIVAYGIRLPGIFLIPCFHLALFFDNPTSKKKMMGLGLSLLGTLTALLIFEEVIKPELGLRSVFRSAALVAEVRTEETVQDTLFRMGRAALGTLGNLGLWLLVLLPWTLREWGSTFPGKLWKIIAYLFIANLFLIALAAWVIRGFPYIEGGNIFYNFGLGPLLLADTRYWGWPSGYALPEWVMYALGSVSQSHLCLLIWLLIKKELGKERFNRFILVFCGAYLVFVGVYSFFDRYLLPPFAAILLFTFEKYRSPWPALSTFVFLFAMSWFALAGTHDYLSWNRAAGSLYGEMRAQGVPAVKLDGGVAMNGFQLHRSGNPSAEYTITFQVLGNAEVIDSLSWLSWIQGRTKALYLIRNPYPHPHHYPDGN